MREKLLVLGIFCVLVLIAVRLFYWQIIQGEKLAAAASNQYYFTLTIPPQRGSIYASDKSQIVINQSAYLIYAEPKKISDKKLFSDKVAEALGLEAETVLERISLESSVWSPLKHKVEEDVYEKLKSLGLDGLGYEKEGKRFYPEASMAAHLVGFVGSDVNGADKGYFGLEGYYDRALKGKAGSLLQEKDARGLPIVLGDGKRIPAEDGQDLELYLDRSVQFILEEKLKGGIQRYGAKEGLVVVMDPATGGILGVAHLPKYDPREFGNYSGDLYPNPLIAHTYEPGSTFKALIMAAALNERVVEPQTEFDETGPIAIGEYLIRTWNDEYHGKMTTTQILEKSSNPGMVFVGKKLGKEKVLQYLKLFGFGTKTGIDLEEEEAPQLRDDSEWREIDLATVAFGQGIAVTPIQMLRAVNVLANAGKLMEPRVVKKIEGTNGKVIEHKPHVVRQVIKPAVAKVITEMLVSAVDNGEAKWAKPKGYRIAGKTGTAQIPVSGHYDESKTIASFVGYAPADKPRFVMLVMLREPSSSPWGSETAAPLFFSIAKELFAYYGISSRD